MARSLPRMHLGLKFSSAHTNCNIWGGGGVIGRFIVTFAMGKHHDGEQLIMEEIVPEGKSPP